eukprot:scaffold81680_cov42-Phaeocystis_antarctica.AAC.2
MLDGGGEGVDAADVARLPHARRVVPVEHGHEAVEARQPCLRIELVHVGVGRDVDALVDLALGAHALAQPPPAAVGKVAPPRLGPLVGRAGEAERGPAVRCAGGGRRHLGARRALRRLACRRRSRRRRRGPRRLWRGCLRPGDDPRAARGPGEEACAPCAHRVHAA